LHAITDIGTSGYRVILRVRNRRHEIEPVRPHREAEENRQWLHQDRLFVSRRCRCSKEQILNDDESQKNVRQVDAAGEPDPALGPDAQGLAVPFEALEDSRRRAMMACG
jgi:hypothetical protein